MKVQFTCQQCGSCCEKYGNSIQASAQDVMRWEREGREDILKHVIPFGVNGSLFGGELWFSEEGEKLGRCPFLRKKGREGFCAIQETKPEVCRKYPFTGVDTRLDECRGLKILKDTGPQ